MKAMIVYRTKYGATEKCARLLADGIRANMELADLGHARFPDVSGADVVLIGGSIYGGKIQREVPLFCERARGILLTKRVGLFICCLLAGDRAAAQLSSAFPPWLFAHAFSKTWLGGELYPGELSFFDRILVRGIHAGNKELSLLRKEAIDAFITEVNGLPRTLGRDVSR